MRRMVAALLAVVLLGCGSGYDSPADLLATLDVECVETREVGDDTVGCDLAGGQGIVVQVYEDDSTIAYVVALSMDDGEPGPWVAGEHWLVSLRRPDADLVEHIRSATGGRVVHSPGDF